MIGRLCIVRVNLFPAKLRSRFVFGVSSCNLVFSLSTAMTKSRNKKKRNGVAAMEMTEGPVADLPQAMDTSESGAHNHAAGAPAIKIKKGRPMKRSKNVRKKKSIEKAISSNEKTAEKVFKSESKQSRTQSAKLLYE